MVAITTFPVVTKKGYMNSNRTNRYCFENCSYVSICIVLLDVIFVIRNVEEYPCLSIVRSVK